MTQKPYKCRVEYLESTGTQYIDTGIMGNGEFNIKYGLYANSISSSSDIFAGTRSSAQHLNFGQAADNGQFTIGYLNQYWQESRNFAINTRYDIEISYKSGEQYAIINGTKGSSKTYTGTEQTDLTIYLFKRHHYGTDNVGGLKGRIYYFTIKQNDVLVRDFIPVLDNSGRPAMYDQVSGQLFYNQGSGEFTYGRQIIPVEYLESTGTQYIDTGVKGKNNLQYKTKINYTNLSTSASNGIGGEYLGNASAYIGMVRANGHFTYLFNNTAVETTKNFYANTDYVIDSIMNNGSQVVKVNNETISTGTISGTFTSTRNIFLYAICSTNDAADVYGSLKIYYLQIYDNGTLVRDFIPCIDENLTPFMFDKVHNTVYLNAGTGQFKVGPNVEKVWGGKKLRRKLALALANLKKKRKYYVECEYLEGTGTQYIDTGYEMSNDNMTFDGNIMWTDKNATANFFFGYRLVDSPVFTGDMRAFFVYGASASPIGRLAIRYGVNADNSTQVISLNTKYNISWDSSNLKINGTTYDTLSRAYTPASYKSMFLFWCNCENTYSADVGKFVGRIYNWQIKQDGVLVRDFIPVLDWDMTPCMYDRVTEQLFYNQGTGNFVAGREIHPVDYLESTGTQYINTGLLSTASSTVDTEFSFTSMESGVANNVGVFGGRNYTTTNTFTFFKIASGNPQYFRFDYNSQTTVGTASEMTWDTASKYRFQYNGTNCITTNTTTGESVVTARSPASTFTQYPIHIFAVNTAGAIGQHLSGRIYYYKYSDGTNSVDMIPAIDENGVGYMLDRVSHTIFDNAGTGAFGYSSREVEYLQSDGARAIVAGLTVDDTCGYDVKWMALNSNDTIILGTKGSGDSRWVLSGGNNPNVNISWNTSSGGVGLGLNKIQTAQMNYFNDRKRILNDTPLTDITQTLSANASTYSVGIFGGYWGVSQISLYSTCRIYYAKISKGTGLVRDFIPMVKDGSPCLYDKVGGEYYFGIGTGSFTTGKIVEPEYE